MFVITSNLPNTERGKSKLSHHLIQKINGDEIWGQVGSITPDSKLLLAKPVLQK